MTEKTDNFSEWMRKTGLSTVQTNSPAWKHLFEDAKDDEQEFFNLLTRQKLDISIGFGNGQKMSVGKLVRHRTVPQLGLGLVVAESKIHKNYWIVQWCDRRYGDVGQLGIGSDYLEIV